MIESGDLDQYLPYNMRLEANGMNDDAFDSTEAYDYLTDKIRNGESVLPYDVQQEIDALNYEGDAVQDTANELTEEEINGQLQQAGNEERESATNARIFNPTGENSSAGSSERSATTTEANASQQTQVAKPERRADGDHRVERRTELQTRKNVNDMSADEMRAALLVDDLTGIGNRRAYDESQKLDYQVSIDADGLKWVNDNLGHESGDILLKAIGEAIGRVTQDGYHISGDEFIIQANNENVAHDVMDAVDELLAESIIEGVNSNGDKVTLKGIGVSYGIAKDLKNAENKLQQHKQERETKGQRSGRGEQPANATITSKSQENNQDNVASQDLLGDNTAAKQALADAERAKDAKRNAGEDNQAGFNLSGSDSEFEQARAAGAQDLFSQDSKINLLTNDVLPNSESIEDIKQAAIKIAKEKFAGHTIKNISDNTDIIIGTQGIKHAMSGKVSKVSAVALSKLDEVIAKAKFVKSMPDKSGRNTIKEVRFYEADINLDGSNSKLTVVVRVAADGHRYYDHFEITNPTGQSGKSESQNSLQPFMGLVSEPDNETVLQSNTESNTKDEVSRAKEALDNANVTGAERLDVVAKVRAGALTADDVVEAHGEGKAETTDKIEDFGQKIGGAKKDTYTRKAEQSRVLDIKTEPLAKTWPEPDYQELLDNGTDAWIVSFIRATREDIPRKPVKRHALSRWVDTVTQLRDISYSLLDGSIPVSRAKEVLQNQSNGITDRIELYQLVGHSQSLKGLSITAGKYSIHNGVEYNPPKTLWAVNKEASGAMGNWGKDLVVGNTKQEVLQKFKEEFDTLQIQDAPKSKETSFDIYSYPKNTGKTGFFIGKKVGRNYIDLESFETVAEARAYKRDHNAELVAKLEKYKEIPSVRRDTNNPRVGEDMRNGQNVTKQLFEDTFGFRGVEFGEWVENKKRQQDLNESFDALMDMAAILNIPPKAISLNGELGLAFGARGSGGVDAAKAHYEAGYVVINLTKKDGAGSLGHEWWHGLDNYFSRMRGKPSDFMTSPVLDVSLSARGANYVHQGAVRKEMIDAFGEVVKAINNTSLKARSSKLDAKRSKDYWSTGLEMSARAFETYLIAKIQDNNASNDYLANIVDEKTWAAAEKLGFELDASYPYPTAAEIPAIRGAFDHFFNVIESKETDTGGVALFSRATSGDSLADKLQSIVDGDDISKGNVLIISENSPASLQMFGFNNLAVVTRTGADGVLKMHYEHGLSVSKLASVIENGLKRPAMILQYKGQNDVESLRFVTNETKNGNPIILAIQPEREGASGKVNLIASAFEVNAETIARAINNGDLLYRDTNAPMTDGVRKAVTRAQIKYAREPRSLLGVIPSSASSRKHAYKILSQSDIVKFENNNEGIYFSRAAIDTYSEHSIDNSTNIEEVNDNEAIRRIDRLQEAVRRHVNSRPARISKSVSVNQLARDGGGRGKGAASSWQLAGELANFFDQNVITFNNHTPHIFDFNGVAHGDSIFINANTNRPAHIVFGHEFLHRLKRENIEAYNKLVSIIDPLITDLKGFGKQEGIEDGFNDDYIKEELLGNLVANRFNEAGFWRNLDDDSSFVN